MSVQLGNAFMKVGASGVLCGQKTCPVGARVLLGICAKKALWAICLLLSDMDKQSHGRGTLRSAGRRGGQRIRWAVRQRLRE